MVKKDIKPGTESIDRMYQGIEKEHLKFLHIGLCWDHVSWQSGRLDTAKRALELLRAKTKKEADILAGDLKALNDSRKDMTADAVEQAKEQVELSAMKEDQGSGDLSSGLPRESRGVVSRKNT